MRYEAKRAPGRWEERVRRLRPATLLKRGNPLTRQLLGFGDACLLGKKVKCEGIVFWI
jgi:hypothetical protein